MGGHTYRYSLCWTGDIVKAVHGTGIWKAYIKYKEPTWKKDTAACDKQAEKYDSGGNQIGYGGTTWVGIGPYQSTGHEEG